MLLSVPLSQIFDKLCQSFGGDVLQTLFNTAEGLANSAPENMRFWIWRFVSDQALAVAASNILSLALILILYHCYLDYLHIWLLNYLYLFIHSSY